MDELLPWMNARLKLKYQHENYIYRQYKDNGKSYDGLYKFQLTKKDVSKCNEYRTQFVRQLQSPIFKAPTPILNMPPAF